jgi:hypothetical protein
VWVDRLPGGIEGELRDLTVLQRLPDGSALITVPRYEAFKVYSSKLAERGATFREIAGNRGEILVSALVPAAWTPAAGQHVLFTQPVLTRPAEKRVALTVAVPDLHTLLNRIRSEGDVLEHVYDTEPRGLCTAGCVRAAEESRTGGSSAARPVRPVSTRTCARGLRQQHVAKTLSGSCGSARSPGHRDGTWQGGFAAQDVREGHRARVPGVQAWRFHGALPPPAPGRLTLRSAARHVCLTLAPIGPGE